MTFVFDIDDTILFTGYKDTGSYLLEYFDRDMVEKINKLHDMGHRIILHTGRHWDKLEFTEEQLKEVGIKYHNLVMGNIPADYYVNDKAMTPQEFKNELHRFT